MRVISKFKDYYDGCQGYGADPKLVYVRKTQEIPIESTRPGEVKQAELKKAIFDVSAKAGAVPHLYHTDVDYGVVAFCGKIYPFWKIGTTTHYTWEKLHKDIRSKAARERHSTYYSDILARIEKRRGRNSYWYGTRLTRSGVEKYFNETDLNVKDDAFIYLKTPVFIIQYVFGKELVITNPLLKDYNFASQVDPWTAYQELSMYVGNNLANQMDPEVHISDKLKAESRGFNEWSFRRHKDESKKNKKK
jgi:hypothetical protein